MVEMPKSLFEHADLMWIMTLSLIVALVALLKSWHSTLYALIEKTNASLSKLAQAHEELAKDYYQMKGEHCFMMDRRRSYREAPEEDMRGGTNKELYTP